MRPPIEVAALEKTSAERVAAVNHRMDEVAKLWRKTLLLETSSIERLNSLLDKITQEDLKRVAVFAESLVEWYAPQEG